MIAMVLCMVVSVFVLGVPYRGSLLLLFVISSLFLASTLGMGLLISTITRNQFNAAMVALNAAFYRQLCCLDLSSRSTACPPWYVR